MEAKIECDLIFIRAAEEIAGLSWKAGYVACTCLKDKTVRGTTWQKNSEESFDGLDSGEGAPVRSARVIIEELAQ